MKIDYEFTVGVPVDQAWSRMLDLEKVAPCPPGATLQEEGEDGEYAGAVVLLLVLRSLGGGGSSGGQSGEGSGRPEIILRF